MKFSACTDMINWGKDFFEGVEEIRNGGIDAVEFWNWANKDIEKIKEYVDEKRISVPGFSLSSSNEEIADLCLGNIMSAGMENEFMTALEESIETAKKLRAKFLIATVGDSVVGLSYEEQVKNIKSLISKGIKFLEDNDIILLLEPLCYKERPGYIIPEVGELLKVIKEFDCERYIRISALVPANCAALTSLGFPPVNPGTSRISQFFSTGLSINKTAEPISSL